MSRMTRDEVRQTREALLELDDEALGLDVRASLRMLEEIGLLMDDLARAKGHAGALYNILAALNSHHPTRCEHATPADCAEWASRVIEEGLSSEVGARAFAVRKVVDELLINRLADAQTREALLAALAEAVRQEGGK